MRSFSTQISGRRNAQSSVLAIHPLGEPAQKSSVGYHHRRSSSSSRHHSRVHVLETNFDGTAIQDGVMFDIRALPSSQSVTIESLSFITSEEQPCDVEVFTKTGSHQYFEETRSAWTLVVNDSIQCLGPIFETVLTKDMFINMDDLLIEGGTRRAFYIRLNGADIVYSMVEEVNEVFTEDSYIQILTGAGLGGFFQTFMSPRMWNGKVGYVAEADSLHFDDQVCSRYINSASSESTSNNFGLMFDVKSKVTGDLSIKGFEILTDTNDSVEYEIYAIPNGFEFGLGSMANWQSPIARGTAKAEGNQPLVISGSDFEDVKIIYGKTVGFYVTLKSRNLLYHVTALSPGSTFVQNDDIILTVGSGVANYPQDELFYPSRGIYGRIYYTLNDACDLETTVSYYFVVHYPTFMSAKDVTDELKWRIKADMPGLLQEDKTLKQLKNSHALDIKSVDPSEDNGNQGACATSKEAHNCMRVTADIIMSHEDGIDPGMVEFGLLKNTEKVTKSMSLGDLDVYYAGDEPLDTNLLLTISGVPKKRMELSEIRFFELSTKRYLKNHAESDDVEILSVEVKNQVLGSEAKDSISSQKFIEDGHRFLDEDTTTIDISTVITGKHRPPSPGLDFDELMEDSINADGASFKEQLTNDISESGSDYFSNIDVVTARTSNTLAPTMAPEDDLGYAKVDLNEKGLGVIGTLLIIIGAAVLTFAVVFGTFILHKRRQEKKRFKISEIDMDDEDDEDDPLFFDIMKSRKNLGENQARKAPPKNAFTYKEDDQEAMSSFGPGPRISTQEVVVDINGDSYVAPPDSRSTISQKKKKNENRPLIRLASSKSRSTSSSGSQYDIRASATSSRQQALPQRSSGGNRSSLGSKPEYKKFKDANGYEPPPRRKKSASSMKSIDLDNHIPAVNQNRMSLFDRQQADDDDSSFMSSSTSSTLSSGNVPGTPQTANGSHSHRW